MSAPAVKGRFSFWKPIVSRTVGRAILQITQNTSVQPALGRACSAAVGTDVMSVTMGSLCGVASVFPAAFLTSLPTPLMKHVLARCTPPVFT